MGQRTVQYYNTLIDMTIEIVARALELQILSGESHLEKKVVGGYCSDLLSDVIGNSKEGQVWITMQSHKNIIAVASLKDLAAIIIVNGGTPAKETLDLSNNEGIPVLRTVVPAFEIAGKLYKLLSENEPVQG
jgi:predicted transcriptional regulator